MALIELGCETRASLPASVIVKGETLAQGQLIGAKLGDGEFAARTHELLDPVENKLFLLRAIGRNTIAHSIYGADRPLAGGMLEPESERRFGDSIVKKLNASGTVEAIHTCFETGLFVVKRPLNLTYGVPLSGQKLKAFELLCAGGATGPRIAKTLGVSETRAKDLRSKVYATFRTRSPYAVITTAYLAGILPTPGIATPNN